MRILPHFPSFPLYCFSWEERRTRASGEIFYLSCVAAPSPKMSTLFYEMSDGRRILAWEKRMEREESSKKTSLGKEFSKQNIPYGRFERANSSNDIGKYYRCRMPSGSRESLFGKGFKARRRGPRGQKGARHVWFDRARKNEIHCEERRERILSQSLRSFVRTAKGKNPSNRVQNRQLKSRTRTESLSPSSARSFVPSIDQMRFLRDHSRRFSKDFRMPTPRRRRSSRRSRRRARSLRISRAKRSAAQKKA